MDAGLFNVDAMEMIDNRIIREEGVVAELDGMYWGVVYKDSNMEQKGWVHLADAEITNPRFCEKPTDFTYNPENALGYNPHYDELLKARLVHVVRVTTTETEIK